MLEEQAHICPVKTCLVPCIFAAHFSLFFEWFPKVGADDTFVSDLRPEGSFAQSGFEPSIYVEPEDIGPVEVEGVDVRSGTEQFEAVFAVVPIYPRLEMQRT